MDKDGRIKNCCIIENKNICHLEFKNGWGIDAVETPMSEDDYSILVFTHINGEPEYDVVYSQTNDIGVLVSIIQRVYTY